MYASYKENIKEGEVVRKIPIFLIRLYQIFISPYLGQNKCKYYPTCSNYAIQAYQKYGVFKGTLLSVWRILRCNPFSKGGYDPLK